MVILTSANLENLALIALAFAVGGVLKGAAGAGAPIVAVPMLAIMYNVPTAVALFLVPNVVSNTVQLIQYRSRLFDPGFSWSFALAGVVGAGFGTVALALVAERVRTAVRNSRMCSA